MNRAERTYDELFGLLRETPQATSFTPEEVQALLDDAPAGPVPAPLPQSRMTMPRRAALILGLLTTSVAGIWLLPVATPDVPLADRASAPAASSAPGGAQRSNSQPELAAPAQANVAAPGTVAPATTASGTVRTNTKTRGGERNSAPSAERSTANVTPLPPVTDRALSSHAKEVEPSRAISPKSEPRHLDMATFPMLELSQTELNALGVTFTDGGIQTIGEEYYTIASAEDRATFAQMGMDTTQRNGIVRMRLSIDTLGLTTKKYGWARTESYSRIAPIIALHSYARDGGSSTVAINSFHRSPIIDSAKRGVRSMVRALASVLSSDDVDRVMHDSGHADLARVLVPVHIHLGNEPSNSGTRRRGTDIILWYYPTPEFAAALPERYRISLQKELNAIADVVECNVPPGEACRQMTGEPLLLNYCKRTSGALRGLTVSPNTANNTVAMRYMLESPRTITATLYGIRGEYIRELFPATSIDAGTHSRNVELGNVNSGAYVLVLQTEQGEKVSERLIVQ